MRPMLGATRQAAEVKKRDEMIHQLEEKMQQEAADRQKIEDDRRRAEMDIQRIQKTLESERALALDKEEIFKRLQLREAELSEKLAEAIDDQDKLEDQLDVLMEAKKKAEDQKEAAKAIVAVEQAAQKCYKSFDGEKGLGGKARVQEKPTEKAALAEQVKKSTLKRDE